MPPSTLGPDPTAALAVLDGVSLTFYGTAFSYPVYMSNLTMHRPSYYRAKMAAIGHMPLLVDVMPQYRQVQAGQYASARTALLAKAARLAADLEKRLGEYTTMLETVSDKIQSVTPLGLITKR